MHVEDLRQQATECDDVISRLQNSQGHALQGYGRWMVDLVGAIRQNRHQFRRSPKGPLGASVKLKEQRWSVAIEAVLGGNLFSFVVDGREDEFQFNRVVRQWMSRQQGPGRKPPSCICSSFEVSEMTPPPFPLTLSFLSPSPHLLPLIILFLPPSLPHCLSSAPAVGEGV